VRRTDLFDREIPLNCLEEHIPLGYFKFVKKVHARFSALSLPFLINGFSPDFFSPEMPL